MEKKDKDILKKGLMETKSDFTSSLMNQINAEDIAMKNVLSEHGSLSPSADFTSNLMSQLEGKVPAKVYTPVISKRAWAAIAAVFIGVVILTLSVAQQNPGEAGVDLNIDNLSKGMTSPFKNLSTILYVGFGVLALAIGLVVEQRLSSKTE
jgi:hypothetical protein